LLGSSEFWLARHIVTFKATVKGTGMSLLVGSWKPHSRKCQSRKWHLKTTHKGAQLCYNHGNVTPTPRVNLRTRK
jgi:hypothetical protein